MSEFYESLTRQNRGAWVVHHGQKTKSTSNGGAEFPALDTAGKAATLLSQLSATKQRSVEKNKLDVLAKISGLNPNTELPSLLTILSKQRLIDVSQTGAVEVIGLSSQATAQYAADIFENQKPTPEERASIGLAELTSTAPARSSDISEFISDEFKITSSSTRDLLHRAENVGFVDAEGSGTDKIYFNGNLFRRGELDKTVRVLNSLSEQDQAKVAELGAMLNSKGCVSFNQAEVCLGKPLFDKMRAAGLYDVNFVSNNAGEFGFVTQPSAFHKYNNPSFDDSFDLAKSLVSSLSYGMTLSGSERGRIVSVERLLSNLIAGQSIGSATAIGEDYRALEMQGVVQVTPGRSYGFNMVLLKQDIGEMARAVLLTGDAATVNAVDRTLPGAVEGYIGPEKARSSFRLNQVPTSRREMFNMLTVLRTGER